MSATMTDTDISTAIDDLITRLGVKEDTSFRDLFRLHRRGDTDACVQAIATRLGLPIRVILSYVSTDNTPADANRFRSSDSARTDWTGRGVAGIAAQVAIPGDLPMWGTPGLDGYPISVRVRKDAHEHPATFVAIMAHELSHVLLESLRHPSKDSECHTDLVPILLGFSKVVAVGRKLITSTTNGLVTTTRMTKYGYLTDSQFDCARRRVSGLVAVHRSARRRLLAQVVHARRRLRRVKRGLATFRDCLIYIDSHTRKRMRPDHAAALVRFHSLDYGRSWETSIADGNNITETAEAVARPVSHYTCHSLERLRSHTGKIEAVSAHLDQIIATVAADVRILQKYVGVLCRLRMALLGWLQPDIGLLPSKKCRQS